MTMGRYWVGADPGGIKRFGLAFLNADGEVSCTTVSSVDEAAEQIFEKGPPLGLGIDAPMWWATSEGGGRMADARIRDKYKRVRHSGTVQSVNSLKGAALVGGAMLAFRIRQEFPSTKITESHPKALLTALKLNKKKFAKRFGISFGCDPNEHERDAAVAAVCAREGFEKRWTTDLGQCRFNSEQNPQEYWLAPMHYFWPESL